MLIHVPKEPDGEPRAPMTPVSVGKLAKLGASMTVEPGIGAGIGASDDEYARAGATIVPGRAAALGQADMVLRIGKPPPADVALLKRGCIHVSLLDPFRETALVRALAAAGVSAVSLEMIPRTTLAQKMDVLSSQANLAGYEAVIVAAERLARVLPMMMTPAGTISPSRVFVIGCGVAGLQAIATAKRLGAAVEAFDTRPAVEEQVKSLGAKFAKVDLGETGQTRDGYAKALTPEQLQRQREVMARHCAMADIVITTAQVFGRPAPVIVTADMLAGMKPGSVVVDLAVETGGNVEGAKAGEEVLIGGVRVVGLVNLPGRAAVHASQMFGNNLANFVEHFWDKDAKAFALRREDEILKGCLLTHDGLIVHETIRKLVEGTS